MKKEDRQKIIENVYDSIRKGVKPSDFSYERMFKGISDLFCEANRLKNERNRTEAQREIHKMLDDFLATGWTPEQPIVSSDRDPWYRSLWDNIIRTKDPLVVSKMLQSGGKPWTSHDKNSAWAWTAIGKAINAGFVEGTFVLAESMTNEQVQEALKLPAYHTSFLAHITEYDKREAFSEDSVRKICDIWRKRGWTPSANEMESLTQYGETSAMRIALDYGGDPNLKCSKGMRPLHLTCSRPCYSSSSNEVLEKVELLISKGADIFLCDDFGNSPLDIANSNHHPKVVSYLTPMMESKMQAHRLTMKTGSAKAISEAIELLLNAGYAIQTPEGKHVEKPNGSENIKRRNSGL